MTKRKVLMITRHGLTQQREDDDVKNQSLTEQSIRDMYHQSQKALGTFVQDAGIELEGARFFIQHSPKKRARYTGLARVAGAFRCRPAPYSHELLDQIPFITYRAAPDERLDFEDLRLNDVALKKHGEVEYIARWMADPASPTYNDVRVTPFNDVVESRRPCLIEAINRLTRGEEDLGVIATHAGISEPLLTALVNSGRIDAPVEDIREIGGAVPREGFALVYLDEAKAGKVYNARMVRNGVEYPVSIENLRAVSSR